MDLYRLSATEALAKMRDSSLTVEAYGRSLLSRIEKRNAAVKAWAYLDTDRVIKEAQRLDKIPLAERGPLHGVSVAIKDVIYTEDMPTQHNSPIYEGSSPKIDAGCVKTLRDAGALIIGKTTTTEFAATSVGPKTRNPHDPNRTPGGSSAGSGAAVADFQTALALGTQTGGSMIRPGSFNGVYALKPTWNSITREGAKIYSLIFDTIGFYARTVEDLNLLADVYGLSDDSPTPPANPGLFTLKGAKFAILKTMVWPQAGAGTMTAMRRAASILTSHGANVTEIFLPSPEFDRAPEWHTAVLHSEARSSFLPDYRTHEDKLDPFLRGLVENNDGFTRRQHLEALDGLARLRPRVDEILGAYDAVITPSVPDEAPLGLGWTGSAAFCCIWSALHTPVVNVPGFKGENGLPIGLSLVAPRFEDRRLLRVAQAIADAFEKEGGWTSSL